MLPPSEGVRRTVVILDSSAKTPVWNFINLHLSFCALAPTETPGLAQQCHGMAVVNQASAEICEKGHKKTHSYSATVKIYSNETLLIHF